MLEKSRHLGHAQSTVRQRLSAERSVAIADKQNVFVKKPFEKANNLLFGPGGEEVESS